MIQILIYVLVALLAVIVIIALIPTSDKGKGKVGKEKKGIFFLSTKRGKITFGDPFDNFLVYGGANSGKTKSIGNLYCRNIYVMILQDSYTTIRILT